MEVGPTTTTGRIGPCRGPPSQPHPSAHASIQANCINHAIRSPEAFSKREITAKRPGSCRQAPVGGRQCDLLNHSMRERNTGNSNNMQDRWSCRPRVTRCITTALIARWANAAATRTGGGAGGASGRRRGRGCGRAPTRCRAAPLFLAGTLHGDAAVASEPAGGQQQGRYAVPQVNCRLPARHARTQGVMKLQTAAPTPLNRRLTGTADSAHVLYKWLTCTAVAVAGWRAKQPHTRAPPPHLQQRATAVEGAQLQAGRPGPALGHRQRRAHRPHQAQGTAQAIRVANCLHGNVTGAPHAET
jgi:hypothetical protein